LASTEILRAKREFEATKQDYEIARSDLFRAFVLMRRGQLKDYLTASSALRNALPTFIKLGAETMVAQARSALKQMRSL
jgi:hypothetical protein